MLEETFKTRYYEMSPDGSLPVWILQNYFQESAAVDAHNLSYGWEELSANGVAWILTKVQMQLVKPVSGAQKSRRDFVIFNENGEHIAKGVSWWLIMDLNKRKITRTPQALIDSNDKNPSPIMQASMEKPPKETELPPALNKFTITARLEDLDSNNHVNNSHFSAWAMQSAPKDKTEGKILKEIIINYKAEVRFGDVVEITAHCAGENAFWHLLKRPSDGKEIAMIYTNWE